MKSKVMNNKRTWIAWLFIVLYSFICLYIHMAQLSLIPDNVIPSDLSTHIVISNGGWIIYSGIFLVINLLYKYLGELAGAYAVAVIFSLMDLLGVLVTAYFLKYVDKQNVSDCLLLLEALALNVVLNCALPGVASVYISGNMWGNITYTAMKPFAMIVFFIFIELRKKQYNKSFIKYLIAFLVMLTISTGLKPNFTVSLMPLVGISVIYDFCKKRISIIKALSLAGAFLPSFYIMYKQYRILFQGQGAGSTAFMPGYTFSIMSDYVVLMILLSILFPLIVTLYNASKMYKDIFSRSVLYLWIINLCIAFLFGENGYRQNHGNFLWGLFFATFLWFVDASRWYSKNISEYKATKDKKKLVIVIIMSASFILHMGSGIVKLVEYVI